MLSDDTIKNRILYRSDATAANKLPFLVPVNAPKSVQQQQQQQQHSTDERSRLKTVKIFRPETIKRAHNDAIMAASIGDLNWLKLTLKILDDNFCDKNVYSVLV